MGMESIYTRGGVIVNKQFKNADSRGIEWRPVVGYEGLYEVSSDGQVKSLPRRSTPGKVLTPQLNNSGYLRVAISTPGTHKYLYVHHLVAQAFIGDRPDGCDVNHIDGDKQNNQAFNLEYTTRAENMRHAREIGLHDNRGERQWNAKLTEQDARDIRYAHNTCGIREDEMAPTLGVSPRTVKDVLERKTWRHIHE